MHKRKQKSINLSYPLILGSFPHMQRLVDKGSQQRDHEYGIAMRDEQLRGDEVTRRGDETSRGGGEAKRRCSDAHGEVTRCRRDGALESEEDERNLQKTGLKRLAPN